MRSGGVISSGIEQTLTPEAASLLKLSLSLARRRGHAHLTPLHLAATLLSSSSSNITSLFTRACLSSSSSSHNNYNNHIPLQCRALELCFNVALNRLPTTPPTNSLHHQYYPSLSNALIAALKRAQAHQRRGSIEQQQNQQQQPLLAIKVELESLIISILDDPSVSRVMREAGFSSTAVKNNVEHYYTNSNYSSSSSSSSLNFCSHFYSSVHQQSPPNTFLFNNNTSTSTSFVKEEDVKLVLDVLLRNNNNSSSSNNKKKRNTVILCDSVPLTQALVMEVITRFEKGDDELVRQTRFLKLFQFLSPVSALRFMKRQDVEKSLVDLKRNLQDHHHHHQRVVIYVGDLKWTIDDDHHHHHGTSGDYNPVDHVVEEIAGLVNNNDQNHKVRIMGSATYQTYMRCQMRQPPLEMKWSLEALSLSNHHSSLFTLNHLLNYSTSSVQESRIMFSSQHDHVVETESETKPKHILHQHQNDDNNKFICSECSSHFEKEVQHLMLLNSGSSPHHKLPAWLQPHGTQQPLLHQMDGQLVELKKKWSRLCHSLHQTRHNVNSTQSSLLGKTSSLYPWWPTQNHTNIFQDSNSISFSDYPTSRSSPTPRFQRQKSCTIEFDFGSNETTTQKNHDRQQAVVLEPSELDKEVKITLALGITTCSFGKVERGELCRVLKENVPWQSETLPSIVEAIIISESANRELTWLLIHGNDLIGKRRLACAMAESILGSADMLIQLKRKGNHVGRRISQETEIAIITEALKSRNKIVVLVEDIDSMDTQFMKFLSDGFETGKFSGQVTGKDEANSCQAIFILTKEGKNDLKDKEAEVVIQMTLNISEAKTSTTSFEALGLDRKRKAVVGVHQELTNKSKNRRTCAENIVGLDLNVMAKGDQEEEEEEEEEKEEDEEDEEINKPGELSPISSDLTRETENMLNPNAFVECMEKTFAFERSPAREREMAEVFQDKMEKCFKDEMMISEEEQNIMFSFRVEERVLEEVCNGCGYFTNSLFEKWVKQVFEKALKKVRFSGKEKIMGGLVNVRLCLGGGGNLEEGLILEDGFMGSCLPNKIQLFYKD